MKLQELAVIEFPLFGSRCMGLISIPVLPPSPGHMGHRPDNGLGAGGDVDVLHADRLGTAAAVLRQGLQLRRVGPQQLRGQIAPGIDLADVLNRLGSA